MGAKATRRGPGGFGLAIGTLALVAGLIVAVLWVSRMQNVARGDVQEPEAVSQAPLDPFAEVLPPSDPEASADPFALLDDPDRAPADAPGTEVPEPGQLTGSVLWQQALETTSAVPGRLMLSREAEEKDQPAEARRFRREAIAKLEEALRLTEAWYREEVRRFDPGDLQVRTVERTRTRWQDQLENLKRLDAP